MRRWLKYVTLDADDSRNVLPIDQSYEDHKAGMGGYEADEAYHDKAAFFRRYFEGFQSGRLIAYEPFLRRNLDTRDDVLSVASGRCALELRLREEGYRIVCSDLGRPDAYNQTVALFPDFEFFELDVMKSAALRQFDAFLCLSLIYLFDQEQLANLFRNAYASLKPGGRFILDSAGSPDNLLSYLIHDYLLRGEAHLKVFAKRLLKGQKTKTAIKEFGWRRTDREIISQAALAGFELVDFEATGFLTEFRRSFFLNRLIDLGNPVEKLFTRLGRQIPYIRLFCFRKAGSVK